MGSSHIRRKIRSLIESECHRNSQGSTPTSSRIVFLMRGLPSCGKSTTARQIAGDNGAVIETDAFFQGDSPGPENYHFDSSRLDEARRWTLQVFEDALSNGISPIVIDRGNGRNLESKVYVEKAISKGYSVELCEPDSVWWQEIRVLLRYRPDTNHILDIWAEELARLSKNTHRVGYNTIRGWMSSWVSDLSIDDIMQVEE